MTTPVTTAEARGAAPRGAGAGTRRTGRRRVPSPLLLGVIAVAWLVALAAELTGRADLVHHHELVESTLPLWGSLTLFLVAWQLHVAAMMLPASLPLIHLFGRASENQPRHRRAMTAFLAGYLAVWTVFALVALSGDAVVHAVERRWTWLAANPHVLGGGVLLLAGAFQFSAFKDSCLRVCRHPAMFLAQHYQRGTSAAFALGRRHGLFCLGCCWALMLVMFAVGIANLAWMAPLALLMLFEKTSPRGDRGRVPIGLALLLLGGLVLADPSWLPDLFVGHAH